MFSWMSPFIHNLSFLYGILSWLFIKTKGQSFSIIVPKNENGATAKDVPIIITKSAFLTISGPSKNYSGNCSPKKIMSGFTKPWQDSHFITSSFYKHYFHFYIEASFLHKCFIQWADLAWPCAWISFYALIPALVSRSSMFCVKFLDKTPSS